MRKHSTIGRCCMAGVLLAVGLMLAPAVASAERRVALVIGNAAYEEPDARLTNAINDARKVATALRELDFDDVFFRDDLDREGMEQAVDDFIGTLRAGDVAVFYYAGHGLELDDGENYLAPVDFSSSYTPVRARNRAVQANEVQALMQEAGAETRIMILDACRNNPFERTRSLTRGGLGQMTARGGLVAYATEAGDTAADNGLYAQHLVAALRVPGLPAMELFTRVSEAVEGASRGAQVPIQQFGSTVGRFVFHPGDAIDPVPDPAVACRGWNTEAFFESATVDDVSSCLSAGAESNVRDGDGRSPLMWAAYSARDPAVIDILLDAGADPNARDTRAYFSVLHYAADNNTTPAVLEALLSAGADPRASNERGATPLHQAARNNDEPHIVGALVTAGAEIDARNTAGATPLHWAAGNNDNLTVIEAVLTDGGDVDARDNDGATPLHMAARSNENPAVVATLLAAGADLESRARTEVEDFRFTGQTPLHYAARGNNPDMIAALLAAGANVEAQDTYVTSSSGHGWTPLHYAARSSDNPAVVQRLLLGGANLNAREPNYWGLPLHEAARYNTNPAVIEALLEAGDISGYSPNATNGRAITPLHYAAQYNDLAVVDALLEGGAEVDLRIVASQSAAQYTPLHYAAWGNDDPAVIDILLAAGADLEARTSDSGRTALRIAVWDNEVGMVDALLAGGADPNAVEQNGNTPLHVAVVKGDVAVVESLLDAGADARAENASGDTPMEMAIEQGTQMDIVEALRAAGR